MVVRHKVFKKRGVSPLIATFLLISFVVALGSVVLNWGRNFEISKPEDMCSDVSIKIRNIGGHETCYSGSGPNMHIKFILDNEGSINVNGLAIWIIGEKGTKLIDQDDISINAGQLLEIKDNKVTYDFNNYGKIKQVQFIPKVKTQDSIEVCPRNAVKTGKIGAC